MLSEREIWPVKSLPVDVPVGEACTCRSSCMQNITSNDCKLYPGPLNDRQLYNGHATALLHNEHYQGSKH